MKQQVDITLKLSLWLDATLDEDEIITHVRASLPIAFGDQLTAMQNPVDILDIKQEAEIYGATHAEPIQPAREALLDALEDLMNQADEDCPLERRSSHLSNALTQAMLLLEMSKGIV